jgi:soluble lytic murein transglycosylase
MTGQPCKNVLLTLALVPAFLIPFLLCSSDCCEAYSNSASTNVESAFTEGKRHCDNGDMQSAYGIWSKIFGEPVYGSAAYILLSKKYLISGKPELAEQLIKRFSKEYPGSVYSKMAEKILTDSLYEQSKAEALKLLSTQLSSSSERKKPAILFKLATIENRRGNHNIAANNYRKLFLEYPAAVEGLKSVDELASLVTKGKITKPVFTDAEQMSRAARLYSSGRFDLAADAYQALLKKKPSDNNLTLKIARCRFKERRNEQSLAILKRISKGNLTENQRLEALTVMALIHWRMDRYKDFEECCKLLMEKGPASSKQKALFYLASYNFERGNNSIAQSYFERLIKQYPQSQYANNARWRLAWIHYLNGKFDEASESYKQVRYVFRDGKMDSPSKYWEARSLIRGGRVKEAELLLKNLVADDPMGYYGLEAERIVKSSGLDVDRNGVCNRKFPDLTLSPDLKNNPLISAATKLMEKGVYDLASINLEALPAGMLSSPPVAFLAARAAYGSENYSKAWEIIATNFGDLLRNPPQDTPPEILEIAFPRVHLGHTVQTANKHSMDPNLVWALIRQESRYNPNAVSPAGALGLMQITPAAVGPTRTSRVSADNIAQLLDPKKNISLGVQLLSKNLNSFHGNMVPAIAAYNADIKKVREWVHRNGKLQQDEFVELIPFQETRNYVKHVLAGYAAYKAVHKKRELAGYL